MALVKRFLEQISTDFQTEAAQKKGGSDPKDQGGREMALAGTVKTMADAFGSFDTHHEAVLGGFRFLSSQVALGRMGMFAAAPAKGGMIGRGKTLGDLAQRLAKLADDRRVTTFGNIPGVLSQASVAWDQVVAWAREQIANGEHHIERLKANLPLEIDGAASKAEELTQARTVLAGLSATGQGSERYPTALATVKRLEAEYEVARSQQQVSPERQVALAKIAEKESAIGRERAMLVTWSREAQVLREAARLGLSPTPNGNVPQMWTNGPILVLNTSILTSVGDYTSRVITKEEAQAALSSGFVSHVGHQGTSQILTSIFGQEIPMNRAPATQQVGQHAIIFQLKARGEEGRIYTAEEVEKIGYELRVLTRIS